MDMMVSILIPGASWRWSVSLVICCWIPEYYGDDVWTHGSIESYLICVGEWMMDVHWDLGTQPKASTKDLLADDYIYDFPYIFRQFRGQDVDMVEK